MSWVARKVAGLDNEDQQQVITEYFDKKMLEREKLLKEFWEEYKQEQPNG